MSKKTVSKIALVLCFMAACAQQDNEQLIAQKNQIETMYMAEKAATSQTIERLQGEVKSLLDENTRLREKVETLELSASPERVAQLQRQIKQLEDEATRYRMGLASAVDELNKNAQEHQLKQQLTAIELRAERTRREEARRAPKNSGGTECCIVPHDPYLLHVGTTVVVSGDVSNTRSSDARGELLIELFDDDKQVDSQTVAMMIPGNLKEPYEVEFSSVWANGSYRARAVWNDGL